MRNFKKVICFAAVCTAMSAMSHADADEPKHKTEQQFAAWVGAPGLTNAMELPKGFKTTSAKMDSDFNNEFCRMVTFSPEFKNGLIAEAVREKEMLSMSLRMFVEEAKFGENPSDADRGKTYIDGIAAGTYQNTLDAVNSCK